MKYEYANLVFEGGGVKGIAYVGVLEALTETPLRPYSKPIDLIRDIKRVAGTSAGAMTALLVSLNYSVNEIKKELFETDFSKFADTLTWVNRISGFPGRFFRGEPYICEGEELLIWINKVIKKKVGKSTITFQELRALGYKDLYIIGTNLTKRRVEIFSPEHTPNMPIDIAVRTSMAIPLYFKGVKFSIENKLYDPKGEDIYVDGGVIANYPIEIFDNKKYIINEEYSKFIHDEAAPNLPTPPRFELLGMATHSHNSLEPIGLYRFINAETIGFKVDSKDEIDRYSTKIEENIKENTNDSILTKILPIWENTKSLGNLFYSSQEIIRGKTENLRTVYIDCLKVGTTNFSLTEEQKNALIKSGHIAWESFKNSYSSVVAEWRKDNNSVRFGVFDVSTLEGKTESESTEAKAKTEKSESIIYPQPKRLRLS